MKTFLLLCSLIVGNSIGEILLAKGMQQVGDISFHSKRLFRALRRMARNPYLFAAITCLAISFFSFIGLLSYSDLSFIVPLTAVCYITNTIGAHFFLKERISQKRWLGTLLVAFGVLLISFDKRVEEAFRTKAFAWLHQFYSLLIPEGSMVSSQSPVPLWGIFTVRVVLFSCIIVAIVYFLIIFGAGLLRLDVCRSENKGRERQGVC